MIKNKDKMKNWANTIVKSKKEVQTEYYTEIEIICTNKWLIIITSHEISNICDKPSSHLKTTKATKLQKLTKKIKHSNKESYKAKIITRIPKI